MILTPELHILLIVGSILYLLIIFWLLKKNKLNVQYSILWLASAFAFILFAIFPQLISFLRYIFGIETSANFVFTALFAGVLLLLLSLSTIVTGFAAKIKKLTQTQALLEKRVRELEDSLEKQKEDTTHS